MVSALYGLSLHAQDIRHADFPACLILTAHLAAPGGALAEADERNTDTARIQADGGVALFASRNPRDYDLTPDSCRAVNSAVMAARTSSRPTTPKAAALWAMAPSMAMAAEPKHLGQNVSWWDLAKTAKIMTCRRGAAADRHSAGEPSLYVAGSGTGEFNSLQRPALSRALPVSNRL